MSDVAAEEERVLQLLRRPLKAGTVHSYGDDPDQLWEAFGAGSDPTLVFVHGGYYRPGTDRSHARAAAVALADAGYQVVLAEYRRIPGSPMVCVDDLRTLERVLKAEGDTPALWMGHSAGGQLVQQRAYDDSTVPTATVALAPVGDLRASDRAGAGDHAVRAWIGCLPEQDPQLWDSLDPSVLVTPDRDRWVRVLHGDQDASVDIELNRRYHLTALPGAHHFDLINPESRYWAEVLVAAQAALNTV